MERERKVFFQELSMVEETPDDWINDVFFNAVWKGQPLGRSVIGSRKTIMGISRTQLVNYFHTYYRPENMVIGIAGDIDFNRVTDLCEKYFQFPKLGAVHPAVKASEYKAAKKIIETNTEQVHLLLGCEGIGFQDPFHFDALILSFFWAAACRAGCFKRFARKRDWRTPSTAIAFRSAIPACSRYLSAIAPSRLQSRFQIIKREIRRLKEEPLTDKELNLVKGQLKGTIILSSIRWMCGRNHLGETRSFSGRYVSVEEVIKEIEAVTTERIHELVKRTLVPEKQSIVMMGKIPKLKDFSVAEGGMMNIGVKVTGLEKGPWSLVTCRPARRGAMSPRVWRRR